MLCIAAAALLSSLMQSGVRLAGAELGPVQIVFVRTAVTSVVLLPLLLLPANRTAWRSRRPGLELLRGCVATFAITLWFYAITTIPLAQAVTLSFTMSIFVTVGAAVILREPVGARRWSAVAAGVLGALIIVRPGMLPVSWGALAVLLSSALWAANLLMTKRLSGFDSNLTIVLWMSVVVTLALSVPALTNWVQPSPRVAAIAVGIGLLSALIGLLIANGVRHADVSATQPIGLTRLVWAALFGYLLFDEVPDLYTWLGAAVILGSSLYISYREARVGRTRRAEARRVHRHPPSPGAA